MMWYCLPSVIRMIVDHVVQAELAHGLELGAHDFGVAGCGHFEARCAGRRSPSQGRGRSGFAGAA